MDTFSHDVNDDSLPTRMTPNKLLKFLIYYKCKVNRRKYYYSILSHLKQNYNFKINF